jgi:uncharacterized protein (TIGR02217 family)
MPFFEVQFPTTISYRAVGGPGFSTTINKGFSGQEGRNKNRAFSRGKWTVSLLTPASVVNSSIAGPTTRQEFIDLLLAFFLVVSGRADSFRLKDHKDFQFTASPIGTGDGTNTHFQLIKNYSIGGRTYTRTIYKPITAAVNDYLGNALPNTITVYDNGTPVPGANYSVDQTTGIVTFVTAPLASHAITASGQFHFPVRFDTDDLPMQLEESDVAGGNPIASINSITLLETLAPNF